jgi:hypothetical protein
VNDKIWPNSGSVFKNDKKESEKHADFRGNGEVTCPHCSRRVLFFIDMWKRLSAKTGDTWVSMSMKIKDKQPDAGEASSGSTVKPFSEALDFGHSGGAPKRQREINSDDTDIPF